MRKRVRRSRTTTGLTQRSSILLSSLALGVRKKERCCFIKPDGHTHKAKRRNAKQCTKGNDKIRESDQNEEQKAGGKVCCMNVQKGERGKRVNESSAQHEGRQTGGSGKLLCGMGALVAINGRKGKRGKKLVKSLKTKIKRRKEAVVAIL